MAEGKIPPHSQEAETSIIGAILIDKDAIISVAEFLRPEHFYNENHGSIFKAILDLYEERSPIDIVTVGDKLKKNRALSKVGGSAFLVELVNSVPTAANAEKYGLIVKDLYIKRQLISAAGRIVDDADPDFGGRLDRRAAIRVLHQNIRAIQAVAVHPRERLGVGQTAPEFPTDAIHRRGAAVIEIRTALRQAGRNGEVRRGIAQITVGPHQTDIQIRGTLIDREALLQQPDVAGARCRAADETGEIIAVTDTSP